MLTDRPQEGDIYTYNDGRVRFVVLLVEDDHAWGLPLSFVRNEYDVPAIRGTWNHRDITGAVCAGLMSLPRNALKENHK